MNFEARVSGTGGGSALGHRFWSPADGCRIGPMGPRGKAAPNRQPTNPKVQDRSGVLTRAACVSRLATLFAGHPRAGSLCSMGPPHRVDWRLSRPILMIFGHAVSEKYAGTLIINFPLDSLARRRSPDATRSLQPRILLKHPQRPAERETRKKGKPEMCSPRSNSILRPESLSDRFRISPTQALS
jgi:hypothetical protein